MSVDPQLEHALAAWANARSPVAVAVCDSSGVVLRCNPAFAAIGTGCGSGMEGRSISEVLLQPPKSPLNLALKNVLVEGEARVVVSVPSADSPAPQQWEIALDFHPDEDLLYIMANDLSREAQLTAELQTRTTRDRLTGLENRDALRDELAMVLSAGQPVALFLVDIDDFTRINDTFGHEFGDAVLLVVTQRLRRLAGSRSFPARIGGDQFAVMISRMAEPEAIRKTADALHDLLCGEMAINHSRVHLRVSVGYAGAVASEKTSASDLLREADTALSRAGSNGGNQVVEFRPEFHEELRRRTQNEADLRRAVGTEQLDADMQGIFTVDGAELTGFEALARWRHPDRGTVPPDEFIDVADKHGMLDDVLRAVLERSLGALRGWLNANPSRHLSINVAPSQLATRQAVGIVAEALTMWSVNPQQLVVEITERELVEDQVALEALADLEATGVQIAIDDFGEGASSLGYLWTLPVSVLKLDRRLISSMADDSGARRIVSAMVQMAVEIGMRVVAEGVENEAELQILRDIGCQTVQGFLLHRPCPLADLGQIIDAQESAQASQASV